MSRRIKPLSAPMSVTLMITRRCNLRCLYCGSAPEQFLQDDMTTEELLAVIDELTRCKVLRFSVSGGEPLVHPDFLLIMNAILKHPVTLQINTNATLVTPELIAELKKLPRRPFFSVTIDGITKETYTRIRGVDALDRMKRGVRMLIDGGFGVQTFVVLHRLNYRELPQIVAFAKSLGVRSIRISIPVACGRSAVHPEETALEPEQLREALEITLQVEEENPGFLAGRWIPDTHFYRDLKEGRSSRTEIKSDGMFRACGAARQQITIAPDGTVLPCELVCTCRAGNLREQSFLDIWHNSPVLKSIRECREMPLDQVQGCKGCPWHLSCRGPCPADGYGVTGIWPSTGPTCMTRTIGRLFGYETDTPSPSESLSGSGMVK